MKFEKDNKNKIMSSNHEPPVKKRQRIEDDEMVNNKTNRAGSVSLSPNHSTSSAGSNSPSTSSSTTSVDELDHALGIHSNSSSTDLLVNDNCATISDHPLSLGVVLEQDWAEFVTALEEKQCVCGLDDTTIRRPFQRYLQADGASSAVPLHEWPSDHIVKYLSNVQLFFDIYLKQNARGTICGKFVELCECIVNTQGLNMLEDVLELCNVRTESISNNKNSSAATKYILYLSGRVISCYLIIIKEELDNKWLKKIVDNLFIFEKLNDLAIRRINFSLDIIKYIIEFKDLDEHPLEEDINEQLAVNLLPPIETNYFAQQYLPGSSNSTSSIFSQLSSSHNHQHHRSPNVAATDCHYVTLTDSESFDTTQIKCVTVQILENKWPALVNTMRDMIQKHRDIVHAETCTLTFLSLWENIISVKANLSVVETLPFYAQLDKFELLLCSHLSPIIYKQMLALFNEALCYGSTLALQDILPEETCNLAHHIVRHVRDFRILDYLPRQRQTHSESPSVGFAGQSAPTIEYAPNTLDISSSDAVSTVSEAVHTSPSTSLATTYDKTLLQKLTLLVLKSVAVSVKQIRSDSSDSSIDSQDYEALQDMIVIERSIRDVLTRLETFMKNALEFHPESHFSKILIHLFADQDDYLIEAMVCTLDVTASISFRNNAFPELVAMLNPVYTFLEFLNMISNSSDLLLDLLVSNETCFLLYLLRYLKYIRLNWSMFVQSCQDARFGNNCLDETMSVLIRLRLKISRLVSKSLYPYDISPILRLLESCESLYEGNELS